MCDTLPDLTTDCFRKQEPATRHLILLLASLRSNHTHSCWGDGASNIQLAVDSSKTTQLCAPLAQRAEQSRAEGCDERWIRNDASQDRWQWQDKLLKSCLINPPSALGGLNVSLRTGMWSQTVKVPDYHCLQRLITTSQAQNQEHWYSFVKATTHLQGFASHPVRMLPTNA